MIELLKKPVGMLTIAEMRQIEHALNGQPAVEHSVRLWDAFGIASPGVAVVGAVPNESIFSVSADRISTGTVTISQDDSPEFIEGAAAAMDAGAKYIGKPDTLKIKSR